MADMFVEVSSNLTLEGNVSSNDSLAAGIVVGSGNPSLGPVQYRSTVLTFDSTTGFTAGTEA